MKLKAIKKINITKAASFKDYTQDFDFEDINVFFGYNGCGKTTFSRTLCCLKKKEIIDELKTEDIETPLFSIETKDKTFYQNDLDNDLKIKVFNQDYVSKNINYDNLTGVLIAGEESQDKQDKIDKFKQKKQNLKNECNKKIEAQESIKKDLEQIEKSVENQKSDVAKFIKINLKGFNNSSYTRNDLDKFKDSKSFKEYEELEIDINKEIKSYNATNKQNINILELSRQITEDDIENINTVLQSSVLDSVKIAEITAEFEKWTSDGLELHKNKNQCVFCGSSLTEERKKH